MTEVLIVVVPVLYGGIQTLELSAVLARLAGIEMGRNMMGYALQQSIYMGTRFLLVLLLPLLGLAVDSGMSRETFALMSHLSLLSAAILGGGIIIFRNTLVAYYCGVLKSYETGGRYFRSFFTPTIDHQQTYQVPFEFPKQRSILCSSVVVFTIYSTGMFMSFFAAILIPEYRTSISQSSGILNALGAVLLTFVIEPAISKNIDLDTEDAPRMVFALFFGRWLAVSVMGQLVLLILFWALP